MKPFVPPERLEEIAERIAAEIRSELHGRNPLLIGVLKGAFLFLADIARRLDMDFELDFVQTSCYGARQTPSEEVLILRDVTTDIRGRDIVIVEDIIDRGHTARALRRHFADRGAASVRLCALLMREGGSPGLRADFLGLTIGQGFVVGYGMDCKERLRGLPGLHILEEQDEG